MARFGRFNKNQKRDKNGKWTKGGGSASKSGGRTSKNNRKRVRSAALIGGGLGFFATLGNPVGAIAGAAAGAGIAIRKNPKKKKR